MAALTPEPGRPRPSVPPFEFGDLPPETKGMLCFSALIVICLIIGRWASRRSR